jgi:hypothetical protein
LPPAVGEKIDKQKRKPFQGTAFFLLFHIGGYNYVNARIQKVFDYNVTDMSRQGNDGIVNRFHALKHQILRNRLRGLYGNDTTV